jgi:hypothetical protein
VFLDVIGGARLSGDPRLRTWVRAVTPDAVLEGVSVLAGLRSAAEVPGVVVLDVGGATTDEYCVPDPDAEQATLGREAVGARAESGSSSSPAGSSGTPTPASTPGWPPTAACSVLTGTQVVVDHRYVLAAAGLLAGEHPGGRGRTAQGAGRLNVAAHGSDAARVKPATSSAAMSIAA